MKLNLGGVEKYEGGSGTQELIGFTNVDIRNIEGVDIVCDIRKLPFCEDGTVDEIRASHVIEHIQSWEIMDTILEWKRVLKKVGLLRIYCPDANVISVAYVKRLIDSREFSRLMFGNQDYEENCHKVAYDRTSLDNLLEEAGFEIVGRETRPNAYLYDLGVQALKL